mgnify:CR=1 FL=1
MDINVNDPAYMQHIGAQEGRDPKRLVMLMALSKYLEEELGDISVFRGRMVLTKDDPKTLITILDNPDPDRYPRAAGRFGDSAETYNEDYVLLLQGWTVDDKVNPSDPAHRFMARTVAALNKLVRRAGPNEKPLDGDNVYLLGGLITRLSVEPGVVRPPAEQLSEDAFFWLRVAVGFTDNPNDPFDLS